MCGICGYLSTNPTTEKQLWEMTNTMTHRGPDDSGIWTHEDNGYHIGFGHRRLSIFDLSQMGHQPMETDDGSLAGVYNGEIYNFLELRAQLEKEGYRFRSNCDTEVLLYAFQKWGEDCVSRFNGMFAFAIYDKQKHRAVFIRDRMGKKPLYYYHCGQTFIFGSELKALMEHPEFVRDINREMISAYLTHKYYPAPHTVFQNTYKLEAGCALVWENGAVSIRKYWDLLEKYRQRQSSPVLDVNEAKEGVKTYLRKSVEQRLAADVPVGVFLSGGIDSTLVAGMAAEVTDKPVRTFTIGSYYEMHNEADRAKRIAQHLGTEHTELYVSDEEVQSLAADIPQYFDEPFADDSQIPTMLVSRLAKQDVTVALSGDGGDELFCGYKSYDKLRRYQALDPVAGLVKGIISLPGISNLHIDKRLPKTVRALINNRSPHTKVQLGTYVREEITSEIVKGHAASAIFDIEKDIDSKDWGEKYMLLSFLTSLPDLMLCKTDRASMRYGLELRCPLLDIDVVEYAFGLPMELKYRSGEKKWLLKQIAYDYVPRELLDMPKKGFDLGVAKQLKGPLRGMIEKYANKEILEKQGIFNYEPLARLIDKLGNTDNEGSAGDILWAFLMFQLWYQKYIEDLW